MAEYNNPGWENNSQHSDHSGDSLDNHLCLFEDWPAWKQKEHLARCCPICQDPYTAEGLGYDLEERRECAGCGKRACPECLEGCTECAINRDCPCDWENDACHCDEVPKPVYCEACRKGILRRERCGEWVCAKHHIWHDDTAVAATEANIYHGGCSKCILYSRKKRDTLVREVERNLLLGAKDRAVPVKDAPKATVVLDRLVRTGMEPMASVVLDFAGGRRDGPRRKAKLRAKKDKRGKAPRKQLCTKVFLARQVAEGRVPRTGNWVLDDDDFE